MESASSDSSVSASSTELNRQHPGLPANHTRPNLGLPPDKSAHDSSHPCEPYRLACANAGFKVGKVAGNRLIGDCMVNLLANQVATSKVTGKTALVPVGNPASCKLNIHHGTKLPTFGKG